MTGFIKRLFGSRDRAVELTLKNIEAGIEEIEATVNGMVENIENIAGQMESLASMAGNVEKMATGMESLSKYFEFELKQAEKMAAIEDRPPTPDDWRY